MDWLTTSNPPAYSDGFHAIFPTSAVHALRGSMAFGFTHRTRLPSAYLLRIAPHAQHQSP